MKPKSPFCDKFKDYAVVLTDLLVGWLSRAAVRTSSDKHVTGYMHCTLQSALEKMPHSLLSVLMDIPVTQHCWLYF
ncbi:hypothetical protein WJX82_002876 [Trebouxia sp. C0006]